MISKTFSRALVLAASSRRINRVFTPSISVLELKRLSSSSSDSSGSGSETESDNIMELKSVVSRLNKFAPTTLAESWDNVGLLVEPSPPHTVNNILLTNDLTEPVLAEAIEKKSDFILSYHPPIFVPLKKLTQNAVKERIIIKCIENRIAVFSPHTSYDAVQGGVNDWLVSAFGEGKVEPLHPVTSRCFLTAGGFQVATNVQPDLLAKFQKDVSSLNGVQQIVLNGETAKSEGVKRLSLSCTEKGLVKLVECLQKPEYEDIRAQTEITELSKPPIPNHGMGRFSKLGAAVTVQEAVDLVKRHLKLDHVRLALGEGCNTESKVKTVAVCAGSGGTVLKGVKANLYVTGEMSHHEVLEAVSKGISVILCDHSNTERGYLHVLKDKLFTMFEEQIAVSVSEIDRDPLTVV